MLKYLFDASSVIKALKLRRVDILVKSYVQQLTLYEVINTFRKECYLLKTMPPDKIIELTEVLTQILKFMNILDLTGLEGEALKKP